MEGFSLLQLLRSPHHADVVRGEALVLQRIEEERREEGQGRAELVGAKEFERMCAQFIETNRDVVEKVHSEKLRKGA